MPSFSQPDRSTMTDNASTDSPVPTPVTSPSTGETPTPVSLSDWLNRTEQPLDLSAQPASDLTGNRGLSGSFDALQNGALADLGSINAPLSDAQSLPSLADLALPPLNTLQFPPELPADVVAESPASSFGPAFMPNLIEPNLPMPTSFDPTPSLPTSFDPTPSLPTSFDPSPLMPTSFDPTPSLPTSFDPTPLMPTSFDPSPLMPTSFDPAPSMPVLPALASFLEQTGTSDTGGAPSVPQVGGSRPPENIGVPGFLLAPASFAVPATAAPGWSDHDAEPATSNQLATFGAGEEALPFEPFKDHAPTDATEAVWNPHPAANLDQSSWSDESFAPLTHPVPESTVASVQQLGSPFRLRDDGGFAPSTGGSDHDRSAETAEVQGSGSSLFKNLFGKKTTESSHTSEPTVQGLQAELDEESGGTARMVRILASLSLVAGLALGGYTIFSGGSSAPTSNDIPVVSSTPVPDIGLAPLPPSTIGDDPATVDPQSSGDDLDFSSGEDFSFSVGGDFSS